MASTEDLAKLSLEVYGGGVPYGWSFLGEPTDEQKATGLYAIAVQNDQTQEIVIAYRGTTITDTGDLGADIALTVGGDHPQFVAALEFANQINNTYGEQSGTIISVTGHSLGGGLAQLAADVFGFGGRTFDGPGMGQLTEGVAAAQFAAFLSANDLSFGNVPTDAAVFSNLTVSGSAISSVGTHIGATPAPVQIGNGTLSVIELMAAWTVSGGVAVPMLLLAMNQLDRHAMANIYATLRDQSEQGQLLDRMLEQFLVNGVQAYSAPGRNVWSFFEGLFDGIPPLTQNQTRAVIADMEVLLDTPLFDAGHSAARADLLRAQDRLKMAVQTLTVMPPLDLAQWTEAGDGPRSMAFMVTLSDPLVLSEQHIVVGFPDIVFSGSGAVLNGGFTVAGAVARDRDGDDVFDHYELIIPAGQRSAVLTLTAQSDVDFDDEIIGRLQFTPLHRTDAEGAVTRTLAGLVIEDAGVPDEAHYTQTIVGDLAPLDHDTGQPGEQTRYDDLGNLVVDPSRPAPDRADTLYDSAGADHILAGGGDDVIDAHRGGDDRIEAGAGDDLVRAAAGNDLVSAGPGADIVLGGTGEDRLFAADETALETAVSVGESQVGGGQRGDWLDGGAGDDILVGDAGDDVLLGGGGADVLIAGGGNDQVLGDDATVFVNRDWIITRESTHNGAVTYYGLAYANAEVTLADAGGADLIFGGAGDDWLFGQSGDDTVEGGVGDDVLFGGAGSDVLLGQDGADVLVGDGIQVPVDLQGNDTLSGGAGDDRLYGDGGNDHLAGGHGVDLLIGGDGDDLLDGGDGDDAAGVSADGTPLEGGLIGGAGHDLLYGGAGNDWLHGDAGDIPLHTHGDDVLYGEAGDDILVGGAGNDVLDGGSGADHLYGEAGDDVLRGGAGDDLLVGGDGADVLDGGTGQDTLYADDLDTIVWRAGDGSDTVFGTAALISLEALRAADVGIRQSSGSGGDQRLGLGVGPDPDQDQDALWIDNGFLAAGSRYRFADGTLDHAQLMQRAPAVDLAGTVGADIIYGSDQADVLRGYAAGLATVDSGDELYGQAGDDVIEGGAGNDRLDGGAGADILIGGRGDDLYVVDQTADTVVEQAAEGIDTLETTVSLAAPAEVENIALMGDAALTAVGNALDNSLFGNAAANTLDGLAGDDLLLGRGGDDVLSGGPGADRLFGDDGADRLAGGPGDDTLHGGPGDDLFVAELGSGTDVIIDHEGVNSVEFGAGIDADSLVVGQYQGDDGAYYLRLDYGHAGDALVIRHGLAGAIPTYRFADGSTISHAELVGPAAVPFLIEGTARDDVIHGSGTDDRIDGGAGDDYIDGAAGDDTLSGGRGADRLHGGTGDDVLDGGPGDDTLSGGAGADRYVLHWGMGVDLIIEDGADPGTLELGPGIRFNDLDIWRDGDDLLVRFKGGTDGVRIRDYAAAPAHWQIRNAAGDGQALAGLVAPLPPGTRPVDIDGMVAAYQDRLRAILMDTATTPGYSAGYHLDADGILRRTTSGIGTQQSTTQHYSTTLSFVPVAVEGTAYVQTSAAYVRQSALVSESTTRVGSYDSQPGGVALATGYGGGSRQFFATGAYSGFSVPPGSTVLTAYGSSTNSDDGQGLLVSDRYAVDDPRTVLGHWVYSDGAQPAGIATRTLTHRVYQYDDTLRVEAVTGSSEDDTIEVRGYAIVDGGAGDDVISASYPGTYAGPSYYSNYRWEYLYGRDYQSTFDPNNLGALLYGNAGDDTVRGGAANDVLIGGGGDDILDGGMGADVYVMRRGDRGWDVVMDTGSLSMRSGEVGPPTSPYSDWYYRSIGLPEYWRLSPDQALAPLPAIQPNDYHALAALIDAEVIEVDTVEFATGIALADLSLSWGVYTPATPVYAGHGGFQGGLPYTTLDIAWAPGEGVRVVIPHSVTPEAGSEEPEEPPVNRLYAEDARTDHRLGLGIERFRFADGTLLSLRDLLALAPPPPTFDPQRAGLTLDGTDTDNQLVGTPGADQLNGLAGSDVLYGGAGDDRLAGGAGDDVIFGMDGDDILEGGTGNDTLNTGHGNDTAYGGAGNDTLIGGDNAAGTWSWESLYGEDGDDLLRAGGKFAWVYGGSGNDELHGGAGFSILAGEDGDDTLIAGTGYTQLNGGAGADRMVGNALDNTYWVDEIGDVIVEVAAGGVDTVISSISYVLAPGLENLHLTGAEAISGTGNDGDNYLDGALNVAGNVLAGGRGDDRYHIDAGDTIVEAAGAGIDTVYAGFSYTLGENLEALQLVGGAAVDGRGNGLDNRLTGNHANNRLAGQAGDDELNGGYGNDILDGGSGADRMLGGHGNDVYRVDNAADHVTELPGQGTDTVNSSVSYTLTANVERLRLTGTAAIDGTGNAHPNIITGNAAANVLTGAAGNDTLRGLAGDDTLYGDAGNDLLEAGAGNDVLYGGAGDDTLRADTGTADPADWDVLYGGTGNDTLTSGAGSALLWGGSGDDTLVGGAGYNLLFGDTGDDVLVGGAGTFVLYGGAGNDRITGGVAAEMLSGGDGDDVLRGGAGTDLLSGGAGSDRYHFGRGDGQDWIADYDPWDSDPGNQSPGMDSVQLDAGIAHDQLWFARAGDDLQVAIIGTDDHFQVQGWYLSAAHRIDAVHAGDGYRLLKDQVEQLVQAMAAFAPPASGEFGLPEAYRTELEPVIAANWQAA